MFKNRKKWVAAAVLGAALLTAGATGLTQSGKTARHIVVMPSASYGGGNFHEPFRWG